MRHTAVLLNRHQKRIVAFLAMGSGHCSKIARHCVSPSRRLLGYAANVVLVHRHYKISGVLHAPDLWVCGFVVGRGWLSGENYTSVMPNVGLEGV